MIFFRKFFASLAFTLLMQSLFSQNIRSVDFIGVLSSEIDSKTIQMTENLYLTQLQDVESLSIKDKRNASFVNSYNSTGQVDVSSTSSPFVFYATISSKNNVWICTLCVVDKNASKTVSVNRTYDSYYKILMESKSQLGSIFENLFNLEDGTSTRPNITNKTERQNIPQSQISSSESISGTWEGEDYINKIVILRGGRGFIIFKNGATMNISVQVNGTSVTITQSSKSNASFFPDLPRQVALQLAVEAAPITWNLILQNGSTLSGTKTTLIQKGERAASGTVNVRWNKKN